MTHLDPESPPAFPSTPPGWSSVPVYPVYGVETRSQPRMATFFLALGLFFLTLLTSLVAGAQFAVAYTQNKAASIDEFVRALKLLFQHPAALRAGLPFALPLLAILLGHELGHWFACRHHRIRASFPFFIPAPTLIGTLGAFILIRSAIRSRRALFDVGASGPIVGFCLALPALAYGILRAKVVPGLASNPDIVFGTPLALRWLAAALRPGVVAGDLLLHPVGRAAWVGLFATALNLLPCGQLDGGHILRTVSERWHRRMTLVLPLCLIPLGYFLWAGWYVWAVLLFGLSFFRPAPVLDLRPLDDNRRLLAFASLCIFLLCFMPAPI